MNPKVLVLQGGTSSEREVSLRSAANVIEHLRSNGYDVFVADPSDNDFDLQMLTEVCDVVLPILHGKGGEDGDLQKQLENLQVPFLGAGSKACAITFDKWRYKQLLFQHDILVPDGQIVERKQLDSSSLRSRPHVLKPYDGGSSVDTVLVSDIDNEPSETELDRLFDRNPTMLLEELISGQELTVGVLGDEVLPIILIVPPTGEVFDYENKYNGRSQEIVNPSDISQELQQTAQALALQIHQLTGCKDLSRTDMMLSEDGRLYVLETNTIPGLTAESLLPKMAAANGLDMSALVRRLVELACS